MRAKVIFRMKDRSEHTITVEGDMQQDFYDAAKVKLDELLAKRADESVQDGIAQAAGWAEIESWRTIPEAGGPGRDKKDGIATRSPLQKVRFDLLPIAPLVEVAKVFTFGAYNYGDRNWEEGFSWSRCIGSIWRHFTKWLLGEDRDDESGLHHLAHVIANCLFLMQYAITGRGTDDRQKASAEFTHELFQPINADITKKKGQ